MSTPSFATHIWPLGRLANYSCYWINQESHIEIIIQTDSEMVFFYRCHAFPMLLFKQQICLGNRSIWCRVNRVNTAYIVCICTKLIKICHPRLANFCIFIGHTKLGQNFLLLFSEKPILMAFHKAFWHLNNPDTQFCAIRKQFPWKLAEHCTAKSTTLNMCFKYFLTSTPGA